MECKIILRWEMIDMADYTEELEQKLLEAKKEKEEADKRLLDIEIVLGWVSISTLLVFTFVAEFFTMQPWLIISLLAIGLIIFLIGILNCIKIEQVAGYYECQKCNHKYVPTYWDVLWAPHFNRTRYMECPSCKEKSWQKKVISK